MSFTEKIERRKFLRLAGAAGVGLIVGQGLVPVKAELDETFTEITGRETGNAALAELKGERQSISLLEKILGTVVFPPLEEYIFRYLPSKNMEQERGKEVALFGTGDLSFSKRELKIGLIGSLLFAASHNVTRKGMDFQKVPVSHFFGGIAYWYMQRKIGVAANTAAHIGHNFRAVAAS